MITRTDPSTIMEPCQDICGYRPSCGDPMRWDPGRKAFRHAYDRDLQMVVIWSSARAFETRITQMVAEEFRILARYEVHWSDAWRENNFERLYATGVGLGSFKESDAGSGPFVVLIGEDPDPVYQYRSNVSGFVELTNIRVAKVKQAARALSGGYSVHSSNNLAEFFRDATLILGPNRVSELLARTASEMPGVEPIYNDLVGAGGWDSFEDVLDVLRQSTEYVVLRNFEQLPDCLVHDPEIDVLARDQLDFAAIVNGRALDPVSGSAFETTIAGQKVVFDVRWVGDGYFDARWQERVLTRRVVPSAGPAHPRLDDHFFTLLYHAKVQKPEVKPAYVGVLRDLARELDLPPESAERMTSDTVAIPTLDGYLSGSGYELPRPSDRDVHRNAAFVSQLRMTSVEPAAVDIVVNQWWQRARYSRIGSFAAESDRLRALVRSVRRAVRRWQGRTS